MIEYEYEMLGRYTKDEERTNAASQTQSKMPKTFV